MTPFRLASIEQYHRFRGLSRPAHPLVSVCRIEEIARLRQDEPAQLVQDFYSVALKTNVNCEFRYGQHAYGHEGGKLFFVAPNQVYSLKGENLTHSGWLLLIHPDLLFNSSLTNAAERYDYFG